MLTENIMHDCVVKLLKSNDEEAFECLCKLLVTIGKDLDHARAKVCTVLISCCILPGMSGVSRYPKPFRHFFSKFVFMTPKGDCIVDLSLKTWYHWRATVLCCLELSVSVLLHSTSGQTQSNLCVEGRDRKQKEQVNQHLVDFKLYVLHHNTCTPT